MVNNVEIASVAGPNNAEKFVIREISGKQSILNSRVESADGERLCSRYTM
jgi:hypothetical protein